MYFSLFRLARLAYFFTLPPTHTDQMVFPLSVCLVLFFFLLNGKVGDLQHNLKRLQEKLEIPVITTLNFWKCKNVLWERNEMLDQGAACL